MKIKIYISDDEEIIRNGLTALDWTSLNAEVVGYAADGETVLEEVKRLKPDILLTDINMPKINGITLAKKLKVIMPNLSIVFLTGYSNFEYAQKAIEYNVKSYILKPIDPAILLKTMSEILEQIRYDKQNNMIFDKFKENLQVSRYYLKSWFFNILSSTKDEEQIHANLSSLNYAIEKGLYICLNIEFEGQSNDDLNSFNLFNLFTDINLLTELNFIPFFDGSLFTYILSGKDDFINTVFTLSDNMKKYLDCNYSGNYTIAIGTVVNSLADIPISNRRSMDALRYKLYVGHNQIIYINDVEPFKEVDDYEIVNSVDYISAVKVGSEEAVEKIVYQIFEELKNNRESLSTVKRICLELIIYTGRAIHELGQKPEMLFNQTDTWSLINRYSTVDELYKFIININSVVIFQILQSRQDKNLSIIEMVKEIIDKNLKGGLTLEMVAEQVHLSPCYLSFVFSSGGHITFKEYLIRQRIEKAKQLLIEPDYKVYEIANLIGYSDARYFSDIFKKHTGMTPKQYRENTDNEQ